MFHGIKKLAKSATINTEPEDAHYLDLKNKLEVVGASLKEGLKSMEKVDTDLSKSTTDVNRFSQALATQYPTHDDLRTQVKETAVNTDYLFKATATSEEKLSRHAVIARSVRAYVAEIDMLAKEHKAAASSKTDYELYKSKVDKLDAKEKTSDEKASRNLDKLEASKSTYESTVAGVVAHMEALYAKQQQMYHALYVAFWIMHKDRADAFAERTTAAQDFATKNVDEVFAVANAGQERPSGVGGVTEGVKNINVQTTTVPVGSGAYEVKATASDPSAPDLVYTATKTVNP